jgi:hypothetical protein
METERRYVSFAEHDMEIELRAAGATTVSGISPPFNSKSVDLGGFREIFAETAFDKILERYAADPNKVDVLGLYNHDDNLLLSRTTSGTLRMSKAQKGLRYEMDLPETTLGRDLRILLARGDIVGSSFAFTTTPEGERWDQDSKGNMTRTVTDVSGLYDISIVNRPAYGNSSAALRSLEAWRSANLTSSEQQQIADSAADMAADRRRRLANAAGAAAVLRLKANG